MSSIVDSQLLITSVSHCFSIASGLTLVPSVTNIFQWLGINHSLVHTIQSITAFSHITIGCTGHPINHTKTYHLHRCPQALARHTQSQTTWDPQSSFAASTACNLYPHCLCNELTQQIVKQNLVVSASKSLVKYLIFPPKG